MRRKLETLLVVLFCLGAGLAWALSPPPKRPTIVPRPPLVDPVEAMLRSAEIQEPWHQEGLTIFPVRLSPIRSFDQVLILDEALSKGVLSISEIGGGEVNRVIARNRSDRHIFLMAGEALGGAKQDRMVSDDILLPPHSRTEMAVWCVEQGRWVGSKEFRSGGFVAPSSVRQRAVASKSQHEVWASVADAQRAAGAPAGSLAELGRSERVQEKITPYREKFVALPKMRDNICGVVVAYGREWLAVDIFCEPSLFQRLWPKLLDSYLMEISGRPTRHDRPSVRQAEQFVGQLFWAQHLPVPTPGDGRRIELRAAPICGSALIMEPSVLHLEAFPGAQILREGGSTPPLQYRRERLEQLPR